MSLYKILFFSFFLATAVSAQTSSYHPFPDSAQWNYYNSLFCTGPSPSEEWMSYSMKSDTVINGTIYKMIFSPGRLYHQSSFCFSTPVIDTTWFIIAPQTFFIREDSTLHKIYRYNPAASDELLYDFSLSIGDTTTGVLAPNPFFGPDTVISIDSIMIGASWRRRLLVNSYYSIYWIEGVGSTQGLFTPSPGKYLDGNRGVLQCYIENGVFTYGNSTSCQLITSTAPQPMYHKINVYPNPATSNIHISVNGSFPLNVRVFDPAGKTLYAGPLQADGTLDISFLSTGIYFIEALNLNHSPVSFVKN